VWYFALSQELIFRLKVHLKCQYFSGGGTPD